MDLIKEQTEKAVRELRIAFVKQVSNTLGQFIQNIDPNDSTLPETQKLYVLIVKDMFHDLANKLDSMDEIYAQTSTFSGGEISIRINEIDSLFQRTISKAI